MPETTDVRTVAVLFFDGVEELDAVGPWEVLALWAQHFASSPTRVISVSFDGEPVRCSNGLRVLVDEALDDLGPVDVLIHPGGDGTQQLQADPSHLGRVRSLHESGTLMASVCTGSHVYAAAGLLAGRAATSHHHALGTLTDLDATIEVLPLPRYVDAGSVVTSAGVSAGIDMALHLVERLESRVAADQVRDVMQYDLDGERG